MVATTSLASSPRRTFQSILPASPRALQQAKFVPLHQIIAAANNNNNNNSHTIFSSSSSSLSTSLSLSGGGGGAGILGNSTEALSWQHAIDRLCQQYHHNSSNRTIGHQSPQFDNESPHHQQFDDTTANGSAKLVEQIIRITKGQYLSVGVPSFSSPNLCPYLYVHSVKRERRIVAQLVKYKRRTVSGSTPAASSFTAAATTASNNSHGGSSSSTNSTSYSYKPIYTNQKLSIPLNYAGFFEILSEDGRATRCIHSVAELVRRFLDACIVRSTGMHAYAPILLDNNNYNGASFSEQQHNLVNNNSSNVSINNVRRASLDSADGSGGGGGSIKNNDTECDEVPLAEARSTASAAVNNTAAAAASVVNVAVDFNKFRLLHPGERLVLVDSFQASIIHNNESYAIRQQQQQFDSFLRCFDEAGNTILLHVGDKGKFSPIAREEQISGVHTVQNLLRKRFPLTVRLVCGAVPLGLSTRKSHSILAWPSPLANAIGGHNSSSSNSRTPPTAAAFNSNSNGYVVPNSSSAPQPLTFAMRLLRCYEEDYAQVFVWSQKEPLVLSIPLSAAIQLRVMCAKNMPQLHLDADVRALSLNMARFVAERGGSNASLQMLSEKESVAHDAMLLAVAAAAAASPDNNNSDSNKNNTAATAAAAFDISATTTATTTITTKRHNKKELLLMNLGGGGGVGGAKSLKRNSVLLAQQQQQNVVPLMQQQQPPIKWTYDEIDQIYDYVRGLAPPPATPYEIDNDAPVEDADEMVVVDEMVDHKDEINHHRTASSANNILNNGISMNNISMEDDVIVVADNTIITMREPSSSHHHHQIRPRSTASPYVLQQQHYQQQQQFSNVVDLSAATNNGLTQHMRSKSRDDIRRDAAAAAAAAAEAVASDTPQPPPVYYYDSNLNTFVKPSQQHEQQQQQQQQQQLQYQTFRTVTTTRPTATTTVHNYQHRRRLSAATDHTISPSSATINHHMTTQPVVVVPVPPPIETIPAHPARRNYRHLSAQQQQQHQQQQSVLSNANNNKVMMMQQHHTNGGHSRNVSNCTAENDRMLRMYSTPEQILPQPPHQQNAATARLLVTQQQLVLSKYKYKSMNQLPTTTISRLPSENPTARAVIRDENVPNKLSVLPAVPPKLLAPQRAAPAAAHTAVNFEHEPPYANIPQDNFVGRFSINNNNSNINNRLSTFNVYSASTSQTPNSEATFNLQNERATTDQVTAATSSGNGISYKSETINNGTVVPLRYAARKCNYDLVEQGATNMPSSFLQQQPSPVSSSGNNHNAKGDFRTLQTFAPSNSNEMDGMHTMNGVNVSTAPTPDSGVTAITQRMRRRTTTLYDDDNDNNNNVMLLRGSSRDADESPLSSSTTSPPPPPPPPPPLSQQQQQQQLPTKTIVGMFGKLKQVARVSASSHAVARQHSVALQTETVIPPSKQLVVVNNTSNNNNTSLDSGTGTASSSSASSSAAASLRENSKKNDAGGGDVDAHDHHGNNTVHARIQKFHTMLVGSSNVSLSNNNNNNSSGSRKNDQEALNMCKAAAGRRRVGLIYI